jgi:hypothetical protein
MGLPPQTAPVTTMRRKRSLKFVSPDDRANEKNSRHSRRPAIWNLPTYSQWNWRAVRGRLAGPSICFRSVLKEDENVGKFDIVIVLVDPRNDKGA